MSSDNTAAEEAADVVYPHRKSRNESVEWHPWRLIYWFITGGGVLYAMWSLSVSEESEFLLSASPRSFRPSLYGFQRKQDHMQLGWRTTRDYVSENLKWLLLHPILGRVTAYIAPPLVPVFHSVYSLLMVASMLSWEVAVLFFCEHTLFYALTAFRSRALSYVVALVMLAQREIFQRDNFFYFFRQYGRTCYMTTFVAFHWNLLRCLSFSIDYNQAERLKPEQSRCRWPSYWKTLGYVIYVPTLYLGPLHNYDDYVGQVDKERPAWTLRGVAANIAGLLRCGVHFALIETMTHYIYSAAMAHWPSIVEGLEPASITGFVLAFHFFFYVRYLFTYGFAGALASTEGIEIPPPAKCVARMNKCSQFWRYFDRGMHLYIRRYFYEPVLGNRRSPGWIVLATAAAFSFTWYWHGMERNDGIWCTLSVVGIAFEVFLTEVRKCRFMKSSEERYLGTPERKREAAAILGSPHYLLTILACFFHLVNGQVAFTVCKRVLFGFPFPLLPVLVFLYFACHVSFDMLQWEAAATAKRKQA